MSADDLAGMLQLVAETQAAIDEMRRSHPAATAVGLATWAFVGVATVEVAPLAGVVAAMGAAMAIPLTTVAIIEAGRSRDGRLDAVESLAHPLGLALGVVGGALAADRERGLKAGAWVGSALGTGIATIGAGRAAIHRERDFTYKLVDSLIGLATLGSPPWRAPDRTDAKELEEKRQAEKEAERRLREAREQAREEEKRRGEAELRRHDAERREEARLRQQRELEWSRELQQRERKAALLGFLLSNLQLSLSEAARLARPSDASPRSVRDTAYSSTALGPVPPAQPPPVVRSQPTAHFVQPPVVRPPAVPSYSSPWVPDPITGLPGYVLP